MWMQEVTGTQLLIPIIDIIKRYDEILGVYYD